MSTAGPATKALLSRSLSFTLGGHMFDGQDYRKVFCACLANGTYTSEHEALAVRAVSELLLDGKVDELNNVIQTVLEFDISPADDLSLQLAALVWQNLHEYQLAERLLDRGEKAALSDINLARASRYLIEITSLRILMRSESKLGLAGHATKLLSMIAFHIPRSMLLKEACEVLSEADLQHHSIWVSTAKRLKDLE